VDFIFFQEANMPDRMQYDESDPRHHTQKLKQLFQQTAQHAREDVSTISDPKAQALFETSAEVLLGLAKPSKISSESAKKHGKLPDHGYRWMLNVAH
jgi:hypothetical protein